MKKIDFWEKFTSNVLLNEVVVSEGSVNNMYEILSQSGSGSNGNKGVFE